MRRRLVAAKHVGVQVDTAGPDDRAELDVHGDSIEDLSVITDRRENAADLEQTRQIDIVDRTVSESQPQPSLGKRLDLRDVSAGFVHGSGAIGAGDSGI